jgi:SAM-dependent methyltransferase
MRLTERAHEIIRQVAGLGDVVIDATAGNGHDTCFLAELVGVDGTVFAFDVQATALEKTAARLNQDGLGAVRLVEQDHASLRQVVPPELHGQISVVMFNLGYLPGGDKSVITRQESTLPAIRAALHVLRSGGLVTILAYPGHPGGDSEADAVTELVQSLSDELYDVTLFKSDSRAAGAPLLFVARKR